MTLSSLYLSLTTYLRSPERQKWILKIRIAQSLRRIDQYIIINIPLNFDSTFGHRQC
jgi:hypothetical protein